MLPNCSEFPIIWLALARLGAVMVPINCRYKAFDLAYVLKDSDSEALVVHPQYVSHFREIPPENHDVKKLFLVGGDDVQAGTSVTELARGMPVALDPAAVDPDDLMNIQYTSGTTGFPKGVMTTHEYWLLMASSAADNCSFGEDSAFLTLSPFYYMDAQWELLMALHSGGMQVLGERISMDRFLKCFTGYPVTHFWAWEEMLGIPEFRELKNHSFKYSFLSAFDPSLHKEFEETFHVIAREVYGMTEIGPCLSVSAEDRHMVGSGSVGTPPPFRQLRIVDERGDDVAQGEVGELLVKGPGILKGYYRKPDANEKSFVDGYFRTGDLFRQDENGYYYFVSRKKDMIRRMGDNIAAAEVERLLMSHPKIREAAVVPVPDEVREEEVKAYLLLAPGETPETLPPEEVIEFCLERIAKFKVPRYLEYVDELPRTAGDDKIKKSALIAEKEDLAAGCFDRFAREESPQS
jgi:acyl-CoA synthetase (AMP-forming)/AMP-acid ligase II